MSRVRELCTRVLWASDYVLRQGCLTECRGSLLAPRKPAPKQWFDNELLYTALQRLNTIMPIPIESVHALCSISFGELTPVPNKSGQLSLYDIDGLSARKFDSSQHWIIRSLIYSLTQST